MDLVCVHLQDQPLALCAGFKDECVQILFLRRGWQDGNGVRKGDRPIQAQVCTQPKCSGKQIWAILAGFCNKRTLLGDRMRNGKNKGNVLNSASQ